ncbi:MAG: class I SAM-dependent methyltransferase [Gammaproteobacteria bacterium]|nr:class I SAM-dependent methyltransferase [Gammaproteobacteria bacterium]
MFLRRPNVPVHQNLLCEERSSARTVSRGALEMAVCGTCGFIFNAAFREDQLSYGKDYDNTQDCSPVFAAYLDDLVRHLVLDEGVRASLVVEVGCGKGGFLRRLVAYPGAENCGIGFDPSYTGPDSVCGGRLTFRRELFGPGSAVGGAEVVVCRHVIEHVAQPLELLQSVRQVLAHCTAARVYFETPCVEWILRNRVIWDFFYEHCSLFSAHSLAAAFRAAGFHVVAVRTLFGGQYLWLEAKIASGMQEPGWAVGAVPELADTFAESEVRQATRWSDALRKLERTGQVALWGAGAKGATFANLVDPDARLIDCIVDLNPAKQGKFVPGSGHPIVSHEELTVRGVRNVILMNPNYREENAALLRTSGIEANLVELA